MGQSEFLLRVGSSVINTHSSLLGNGSINGPWGVVCKPPPPIAAATRKASWDMGRGSWAWTSGTTPGKRRSEKAKAV